MFSPIKARDEIRKAISYYESQAHEKYSAQVHNIARMLKSDDFRQYKAIYNKLLFKIPTRVPETRLADEDFNIKTFFDISFRPLLFPYILFLSNVELGIIHNDVFLMELISLEGLINSMQLVDETMSYAVQP